MHVQTYTVPKSAFQSYFLNQLLFSPILAT